MTALSFGAITPVRARSLDRLARVLIGYGVVGLVVAVIALGALAVGLGRVNSVADRFGTDVGGISTTLERTSAVLEDAAATARGFGSTVDGTTAALGVVGRDIDDIVPRLNDIGAQASQLNLLGSQPLAPIGALFLEIGGQLSDVKRQLDTVTGGLTTNRGALDANATSLTELATQTRTLSDRLGGNALPNAIDDLRWVLLIVLGVGALGSAVPAVGAVLVGVWLRRELAAAAEETAAGPDTPVVVVERDEPTLVDGPGRTGDRGPRDGIAENDG